MDFKDLIKQLGDRVIKLKPNIQTEEATKNAFIMPFIQTLGYDVFNPLEVIPEYITDIGTKKGEKIDYLIQKDDQPMILIECKHWSQNLDLHSGQLLRYFHVSKAKFGIITNGIIYRFYTDIEQANKMDEKPFLEIDMTDIRDGQIEELKKFHKSYFEIESILNNASELKYINEIKNVFNSELKEPSDTFVRMFVAKVYQGRATEKVIQQFSEYVRKSCNQVISDIITNRLKSALSKETSPKEDIEPIQTTQDESQTPEKKIETTLEELESYYIIKSILRGKVDSGRIAYRDSISYFTILLDDNNRKPICRLYLSGTRKMVGVFDQERKESKRELSKLDDLYNFQTEIFKIIDVYQPEK
jgi:hypothetical protein